jgi:hypothetical protein
MGLRDKNHEIGVSIGQAIRWLFSYSQFILNKPQGVPISKRVSTEI